LLPSSGLKIGRIFGIDIFINVSWLLIFILISYSLGAIFSDTQGFPHGVWPWLAGFITGLLFFAGLLMHELSHSYVAKRSGIKINRITLWLFGGVAEMGEDVQKPGDEFRMAIAGPIVTFVLGGIFGLLYLLLRSKNVSIVIVEPLQWLAFWNIAIGVFNLLPAYPLDGGRVLRSYLWHRTGDLRRATKAASNSAQVIAVLLAGAGVYFLLTTGFINGIWLLIISFFLFSLSRASYQQTLAQLAAADTRVRDIMYTNVPLIDANTSLTMLRHNYFNAYNLPAFPVVDGDRVVGIVGRNDLLQVSQVEWDVLNAGRISRPLSPSQTVDPDMTLDKALRSVRGGNEFMLVIEGQKVVGLLTREELMRYVETKMKLLQKG
jgi:Zn-dependent protease/predicted transcriptional regulator